MAELHAAVSRKLKELETKEDRFLDLLTDDRLPQAKFREKLRKIQIERTATEARLANSGEVLAVGATTPLDALDFMSDPAATYASGTDSIRRNLNETYYQRIFLDEEGIQAGELKPPFDEFHAALAMTKERRTTVTTSTSTTPPTKQGPLAGGALDRVSHDRSSSGLALALTDILSDADRVRPLGGGNRNILEPRAPNRKIR
ncbi:resolvase [Mycobacteroides abscessus]|uniref:resolvase n=1 Tax=Mycobacteroides abscessus TaxID=36809 RepID=UPI00042A354C|nr:resolvase [Mycobacteroides abscessus]MBN7549396.1 hypothetical protein [Mycobacteroides abscessus subsp. abscessus]MDM2692293.1 hypothetical protein [Mycobacteroides abscessus]MDM2697106.1 hypothetical protein [Mycobacteroides abscessus]MDM2702170.1 hypothetical protein [Mycobacteroides abscessus]MDO3265706.1 hypothetical protein [Mycobacteroides abscessus subsp. abscessus]